MWAHLPVVAVDCGPFESGSGMRGRPGQVPDVVAGCGMFSSVPCVFPVAPIGQTRGGFQLLVDGLAAPFGASH